MDASEHHEINRKSWDAVSDWWQDNMYTKEGWRRAATDPSMVFNQTELSFLVDLAGAKACVLASGNNLTAIALAAMGAAVTSVDISDSQLDLARRKTAELGLSIEFLRADVVDVSPLADGRFDVVHTGGGVAGWIADLARYYSEAVRILKPGGLFIARDRHPFRAIWSDVDRLELAFSYLEIGPEGQPEYGDRSAQTLGRAEPVPSYMFHWTVSDRVMAVMNAGCQLIRLEESGTHRSSWEVSPVEGLPAELLLVGRKTA